MARGWICPSEGAVAGYTRFGTPVNGYPVQGTPNPLQYMARELDALSGLYYVRNRWYDPQQGRFVSEDPIGLAGGINQYAYAANNPVSARDPLGLYPECVVTWWRGVGYANGYQTGLPQYFPQYSAGCDAEVATVQQANAANAAMYGRLSGMQPGGGGWAQRISEVTPSLSRAREVAAEIARCTLDHYGLDDLALRAGSWIGAVPIDKERNGIRVLPGASPRTNLISYLGHKYYPRLKSPMPLLGSNRVFGILGRANLILGAGLVAYDAVSIGLCVAGDEP